MTRFKELWKKKSKKKLRSDLKWDLLEAGFTTSDCGLSDIDTGSESLNISSNSLKMNKFKKARLTIKLTKYFHFSFYLLSLFQKGYNINIFGLSWQVDGIAKSCSRSRRLGKIITAINQGRGTTH